MPSLFQKIFPSTLAIVAVLALTEIAGAQQASESSSRRLRFFATLTGAQEVPAVSTPMSGTIEAEFDEGFTTVRIRLEILNAAGVTGAHFHCNRPGANGPIVLGFFGPGPLLLSGTIAEGDLTNQNIDTSADCLTQVARPVNNIAALAFAMRDGLIYANVHTGANPAGEIRGQMLPGDADDDNGGDGDGGTGGGIKPPFTPPSFSPSPPPFSPSPNPFLPSPNPFLPSPPPFSPVPFPGLGSGGTGK